MEFKMAPWFLSSSGGLENQNSMKVSKSSIFQSSPAHSMIMLRNQNGIVFPMAQPFNAYSTGGQIALNIDASSSLKPHFSDTVNSTGYNSLSPLNVTNSLVPNRSVCLTLDATNRPDIARNHISNTLAQPESSQTSDQSNISAKLDDLLSTVDADTSQSLINEIKNKFVECYAAEKKHQKNVKRKLISMAQTYSALEKSTRGRKRPRLSNQSCKIKNEFEVQTSLSNGKISSSSNEDNICKYKNCNSSAKSSHAKFCVRHGGTRRKCQFPECSKATQGKTLFCISHGGGKRCEFTNCTKAARGSTRFCISHGGGRRCKFLGCTKGARGANFCSSHGGGKRCQKPGCSKGALGRTSFCNSHGGGVRCVFSGCTKSARGKTKLCSYHGGGPRCQFPDCKLAAVGKLPLCIGHGGGSRCAQDGCNKSVPSKDALCRLHQHS